METEPDVQVMVELEGMDLGHTDVCPLTLAREINPRSDKLRSQVRGQGQEGVGSNIFRITY